jgi:hypothetical protein
VRSGVVGFKLWLTLESEPILGTGDRRSGLKRLSVVKHAFPVSQVVGRTDKHRDSLATFPSVTRRHALAHNLFGYLQDLARVSLLIPNHRSNGRLNHTRDLIIDTHLCSPASAGDARETGWPNRIFKQPKGVAGRILEIGNVMDTSQNEARISIFLRPRSGQ